MLVVAIMLLIKGDYMPRQKLTKYQFIAKCVENYGDAYDYTNTDFTTTKARIKVLCKEHGEFPVVAGDHMYGKSACKSCSGKKIYTTESFIHHANKKHGEVYDYSKVVVNASHDIVEIICKSHGSFFPKAYAHLNEGTGCPVCANVKRKDQAYFLSASNEVHGGLYDYSKSVYTNSKSPVTITCSKHGDFQQAPEQHWMGKGCPICGGAKLVPTEEFVEMCKVNHHDAYDYSKVVYRGGTENIVVVCSKHGDFEIMAANFQKGQGCQKCSAAQHSSKQERILAELITQDVETHKRIKGRIEVDIFLPKHNLAVEVNGIYWHSDFKKSESDHLAKYTLCKSQGIRLLQITDADINKRLSIVVSMVNARSQTTTKIYARQCYVVEIQSTTAKDFFTANHISGTTPASKYFGLIYDNKLVSAMSFSKSRFDKSIEWEIIRYATILNTTVVGGASKLFASFVNQCKPTSVISYADLRYGEGNVYKSVGFTLARTTTVGYSYHHQNGKVVSRYSAQKSKLPKLLGARYNPDATERSNMISCGYHKIYDCGHNAYVWRQNKTAPKGG